MTYSIDDRLSQMPYSTIEFAFQHSHIKAEQTNDTCWLGTLDDLYEDIMKKA